MMESAATGTTESGTGGENDIRLLYRNLLEGWNHRDASAVAALCAEDCSLIGFDGSQMDGRAAIESAFRDIFAHHQTAAYIAIVREVRFLGPDVAILRAVAGMVPPGQSELNPAVNAIQTMVAAKHGGGWRIALYQNTPAAFHGRPEMGEALTNELRESLKGEV